MTLAPTHERTCASSTLSDLRDLSKLLYFIELAIRLVLEKKTEDQDERLSTD